MATMTRSDLTFLVDETVSVASFGRFYEGPMVAPMIYNFMPSSQEREVHASLGEFSEWGIKNENQDTPEDSISQQYEKQFVHTAYGKQAKLSRELIEDNKFNLVAQVADGLGSSARLSMEKKAAAVFNDAFTGATYLAEDDKSICNDAHTNDAGGNSQDNKLAVALSHDNLQTARAAHRDITGYEGELLGIRSSSLMIPNELEDTAWELMNSQIKVGATTDAFGQDNYHRGSLRLIVWDFLTDANAWFLLDDAYNRRNLLWFQRAPLEFFADGDLMKGTRSMGGYMRYSHGVADWRGIMGSNPS